MMDPPDDNHDDGNEEALGLLESLSSKESQEEETIIRETINHNDDIVNTIYGQWATATAGSGSTLPHSSASSPNNALLPPHRPPRPPSRKLDPPEILAKARTTITAAIKKASPVTRGGGGPATATATKPNQIPSRLSRFRGEYIQHTDMFVQLFRQRKIFIICSLCIGSMATLLLLAMIASQSEFALLRSSSTSSSSSSSRMIGFHEPSYENIYGANHYYKPPGVGYLVAPRGGLHPIYILMATTTDQDGEDENTTATWDNSEYFDDDYESSPYADLRLQMTEQERELEQEEWKVKLQEIREKYGYWDFKDDDKYTNNDATHRRPVVDWITIGNTKTKEYNPLLGEINKEDFPIGSWQTDDEYITKFISEGRKLIQRVRSAIYEEYGWEEDNDENNGENGVGGIQLVVEEEKNGEQSTITIGGKNILAWMYQNSFKALAKKLLNAMITNDHFFVTLGGHSSAAGHGECERIEMLFSTSFCCTFCLHLTFLSER